MGFSKWPTWSRHTSHTGFQSLRPFLSKSPKWLVEELARVKTGKITQESWLDTLPTGLTFSSMLILQFCQNPLYCITYIWKTPTNSPTTDTGAKYFELALENENHVIHLRLGSSAPHYQWSVWIRFTQYVPPALRPQYQLLLLLSQLSTYKSLS